MRELLPLFIGLLFAVFSALLFHSGDTVLAIVNAVIALFYILKFISNE